MPIPKIVPVIALMTALTGALPPVAHGQDDPRPGIAVMPFDNGGSHGSGAEAEDFEALEVGLQQMLLTELAQNTSLRVVERGRIRELLQEQDLLEEGRVDPATAARIGQIVGARYMVLGGFVDLFGDFNMNARIVDVETSEIVSSRQVRDRREMIYDLLVDLAAGITEGVDLPPLPVEQREARKEREIPPDAITLFSRAQVYEDAGRTEQAITLYRRITEEFPEMEEAEQALRQLTG
jgi:TolB-like protein